MEFKVIYSDRKTLGIQVKDGSVIVRAPRKTPKERIEAAVKDHLNWIVKALEKQARKNAVMNSLTDKEISDLKKKAKIILKDKTEYFSNIMGLKYGRITITSAKTRFGSCSSRGNISYSYRLMLYPEKAVDYVVVHELAHLVEMNHSARFYALVEKVLPDYRERRKLLK